MQKIEPLRTISPASS